jgi:hypothetical protein
MEARGKVAKLASSFIVDGSVSCNRKTACVVLATLE